MEFCNRRFWEVALVLVLVGVASLSTREAVACGGGVGALFEGSMLFLPATVVFSSMDIAASGEGRGRAYGVLETVQGFVQTAIWGGLTAALLNSRYSQERGLAAYPALFAVSGAWMLGHGIYTIANPRIERVPIELPPDEPAMSLAPFIVADRGKQAYGLSLGATF